MDGPLELADSRLRMNLHEQLQPRLHRVCNTVINNSASSASVIPAGAHILPFPYSGGATWTDPTGSDTTNVGRVHDVIVDNNNFSGGTYHMVVLETGSSCTDYMGTVTITNNTAGGYSFICSPTNSGNVTK